MMIARKRRRGLRHLKIALRDQQHVDARNRIHAVIWLLQGFSVNRVANRLMLARSTVFSYLRLYRAGGIGALLARIWSGRPSRLLSAALGKVVMNGLRLMRLFSVSALRYWIYAHDRVYPNTTVRRWARTFVQRLDLKFERGLHRAADHSYSMPRCVPRNLRTPVPKEDSNQQWFDLEIGESQGLRPWFSLAA
jgi:transposase